VNDRLKPQATHRTGRRSASPRGIVPKRPPSRTRAASGLPLRWPARRARGAIAQRGVPLAHSLC